MTHLQSAYWKKLTDLVVSFSKRYSIKYFSFVAIPVIQHIGVEIEVGYFNFEFSFGKTVKRIQRKILEKANVKI